MIQLRPDQQQLKLDIQNQWRSGARAVLGVLPTGGGKSVIVSDIVNDNAASGMRQIVIAHRLELVGQMSLHVARRGIHHRIIGSGKMISAVINEHRQNFNGYSFINQSAETSVASVDTIISQKDKISAYCNQVDFWTIDEAHHVQQLNKWGTAVSLFPRAIGLGVTATPQRADGGGLGIHHEGVFDAMCVGPGMRELINIGALSDYEIVIPESDYFIDDNDITASGDFSPKKMREASKNSHLVGDIVTEYIKYAYGKRAIVFATDVETSGEIAAKFKLSGINAVSVSAKTPDNVRNDFIRRFRNGEIQILVNVDLFGEGFDVPAVEVVVMARPTASLAVYMQQFGRALRTLPGKKFGLVIDHVSNFKRHRFPDQPRAWSLDRRDKKAKKETDPEDIPLTVCANCRRPYDRCLPRCPRCGYIPEVEAGSRGSIEKIDGDLILLDKDKLEEMRKALELESPASVARRVGHVTGNNHAATHALENQKEKIRAQSELSAALAQWAGFQNAMGRTKQESYRRFYLTTNLDVISAQQQDAATMRKLTERVNEWNANLMRDYQK